MIRATIDLPDGKYVTFTEGGGGHPSRIIIQFESMDDMHEAHKGFIESLKNKAYSAFNRPYLCGKCGAQGPDIGGLMVCDKDDCPGRADR